MKYANAYVAQLIALYRLTLVEYIKANKDTLDEIRAKMKDTVLRDVILRLKMCQMLRSRITARCIPW